MLGVEAGQSMIDDHTCQPLFDDAGNLVASVRAAPDLDERGRQALLSLVEAARRLQAEEDAADPVAAADRARRQAEGIARIRARAEARRVREQGG